MTGSDANQVYILGDKIKDFILISDGSKKNINYSMNYDLFTRDAVHSNTTNSGIDMLKNFLERAQTNCVIMENKLKDATSHTISEWVQKGNKGTHLYLERHIGSIVSQNVDICLNQDDLNDLKNSKTIVVYNMFSEIYFGEKKDDLSDILSSMINAENIIIRTKFEEGQRCTPLVTAILNDENVASKSILIFNVNELRRGGFNIRKGVSWEQLVIETGKAIKSIANINKCKAIIVCFNHEGCLLVQGEKKKLICYCNEIEGDFVIRKQKRSFGPILTMQAIITVDLMENKGKLSEETVKKSLFLMRKLISHGYEKNAEYPYDYIINLLQNQDEYSQTEENDRNLISIEITDDLEADNTLLRKALGENTIENICRNIILDGPSKIKAPYLRMGNLLTFDRMEIEQLRSVYQIFQLYIRDRNITKPFSVCVFGQPGSGKSFAVKQIAKSLNINDKAILEFNLSQMSSPQELYAAFHQIRDAGLKGELPLAFFDEFDSKLETKLGWLKYFLAPMQDGEFRENAIAHFIGRAIFVFAGGTCNTAQQFKDMQKDEEAIENKLPDFLSRIKGYLDVTGPNPIPCWEMSDKKPNDCWTKSRNLVKEENCSVTRINKSERNFILSCVLRNKCCIDDSYYLRRATLLRSVLEAKLGKRDGEHIDIDVNVLNAFLNVSHYIHGARSLEAIIQMSDISSKFTASSIYNNYLDLYVSDDFEEFLNQKWEDVKKELLE